MHTGFPGRRGRQPDGRQGTGWAGRVRRGERIGIRIGSKMGRARGAEVHGGHRSWNDVAAGLAARLLGGLQAGWAWNRRFGASCPALSSLPTIVLGEAFIRQVRRDHVVVAHSEGSHLHHLPSLPSLFICRPHAGAAAQTTRVPLSSNMKATVRAHPAHWLWPWHSLAPNQAFRQRLMGRPRVTLSPNPISHPGS